MKSITYLAHTDDLDGLLSHAVMRRTHLLGGPRVENVEITYANIVDVVRNLRVEEGRLIIGDTGYNATLNALEPEFRKLKEKEISVEWFDHHDWSHSDRSLERFIELTLNPRKCTTELVQERFLPRDEYAITLSQLAHQSDFGEKNPDVILLENAVQANYKRMQIIREIASGNLRTKTLREAVAKYKEKEGPAKERMIKNAELIRINGIKMVISIADKLFYMKAGADYLLSEFPEADLAATVFETGEIIFKKQSDTKLDLPRLGRIFNGGGREHGSGGIVLLPSISGESRQRVYGFVAEKIEKEYF
ncbi:hypothetical protein D6745_02220 [Candidatus Woesearchaeota archaeon]|nr:MAG: hypothetical protein D6745_02220 [Candidatus Woesearchaeota archaeon]